MSSELYKVVMRRVLGIGIENIGTFSGIGIGEFLSNFPF